MAVKNKINLFELYRKAFGFVGTPFVTAPPIKTVPEAGEKKKSNNAGALTPSFSVKQNTALGTPFFMPCKLDGFDLPNEPMIEISGGKNIVKTAIDGQDGTFKELYAMNDWAITIRGIAIQEDGTDEYPEQIVRKLREIFEKKKSVTVVNELLSMFNVNLLSIESVSFPATEGAQSWQAYEFTCSSDKEFDLELKEQ